MNERGNNYPSWGFKRKVEILAVSTALAFILSGCDNIRQRRINRLENKIERLEWTQELQADDYSDISDQHNIQLDLKDEWANPAIDQDIYLSWSLGTKKDKDIEKTTAEYREAKERLMRLREKQGKRDHDYTDPAWRMNPDKYWYKKEQFKRMWQKRQWEASQKATENNTEHNKSSKRYKNDELTLKNSVND